MDAIAILDNNIPHNIPKDPKLYLAMLSKARETLPLDMTFDDMCSGFSKLREQATTSPSGKHLGLYKSLVNAMKYNIGTEKESKNNIHFNDATINYPTAQMCLKLKFAQISLAVTHCHTFARWQVVHNFVLEKIPGLPLIHKLRVIHMYEADWSLIQKYYVAYNLNKTAAREQTVHIEQAGGRPGRSAIELAASRVISYETILLQRIQATFLYNNAKACYDQVIENLSNLTLLRKGFPIQIAHLHSQTCHSINYLIKHILGIGNTSHNSHLQPILSIWSWKRFHGCSR
jgi:hypothetical protein